MIGFDASQVSNLTNRFLDQPYPIAQLCGPHGSGKSTLTFAMELLLAKRFPVIRHVNIRVKSPRKEKCPQRGLPDRKNQSVWGFSFLEVESFGRTDVKSSRTFSSQLLIVDGIERLNRLQQRMLIKVCRKLRHGLLLTTHDPIPHVSKLIYLEASRFRFAQIVDQLVSGCLEKFNLTEQDVVQSYQVARGNYREALMQLFDVVETRRL